MKDREPVATGSGAAVAPWHGQAVARLLAGRREDGAWRSELSSSALSTATAVCALALHRQQAGTGPRDEELMVAGWDWLARHQNADGGWGDTVDSPSNLSTTVLGWAALGMDRQAGSAAAAARAEAWLRGQVGSVQPARLAACITAAYGRDRTFSVPILTLCALAGRFGDGPEAWEAILPIPFEMALVPHRLYRRVGLPMVSYALPALIAMGQVRHRRRPSANPLIRFIRDRAVAPTLRLLRSIQPQSGGFLEAAPLTSFVIMSLVGSGQSAHPVVERGLQFLRQTVRRDGSWPIDTNLNVWVTSLAVQALARGDRLGEHLDEAGRRQTADWLRARQYRQVHPYTQAAPGGWAWTELSGGVPDADDTPAALLALHALAQEGDSRRPAESFREQVQAGLVWLLELQNRDGGMPTFCRGWGRMPFDRSSPDLTAHALRAWGAWQQQTTASLRRRLARARGRALDYLVRAQRPDGAWVPLWFGHQGEDSMENPLYGTTRVLLAADEAHPRPNGQENWKQAVERGSAWLLEAQNRDGGWGGTRGLPSSIEESALAVEALARLAARYPGPNALKAVARGMDWLEQATDGGRSFPATPIGLYFARLWYSEKLYPLIYSVAAAEAVASLKTPLPRTDPVGGCEQRRLDTARQETA